MRKSKTMAQKSSKLRRNNAAIESTNLPENINRFPELRLFKCKQAQFKIQEMSFMLVALVLFFIIAGLFFLIISNANLKKSYEALSESKAITTISALAGTPEIGCGEGSQLCVDADKLLVLKNRDAFEKFWDIDGGLVVKKIYPYEAEDIECNAGNYQTCTKFTLKAPAAGYVEVSSYVALCRKDIKEGYSYDKCELGKVSAYLKEA